MNDASRLVRALRALRDGLGNPAFTAESLHESGVRVRAEGAPVLDAAASRVWVEFSGTLGRWAMNPPEAGTLDARRFGALLRVRGFIGERRPLPAREGDTPEARAAREGVGVWVRRRIEAGALMLPTVAEAVRDALGLLELPGATGSARAELPERAATRGNVAALAFARIVEMAIDIRDESERLVQRTKPDTPERANSEPYLHRLAGGHFEERERPGAVELSRRAESLRGMRTAAKVAAAKVSRALAVEVEDRAASIIDAAIGLTGNLPHMRALSAECVQAWAKLNDVTLDALPVVDLLWDAEAEPDGDGAGLAAMREELERLIASAKPGRKPKRRKPAEGEPLSKVERDALAAVLEHGNPHAAATANGIAPGTLHNRYRRGLDKLPAETQEEIEARRKKAGAVKKQAMPTDRRGGEALSAGSDRRRR